MHITPTKRLGPFLIACVKKYVLENLLQVLLKIK